MINTENYKDSVKNINYSLLPTPLVKGHQFVQKSTENFSNWNAYNSNETIKRMIDAYFEKLDEYLQKHPVKEVTQHKVGDTVKVIKEGNSNIVLPPETKKKENKQKTTHAPTQNETENFDLDFVERIPEEIRFLKRYLSMNGKRKTKDDLLRFINGLHRAIIEKKVRKASPYAKQIEYIQQKLVSRFNEMTKPLKIEIAEKTVLEFKRLIAEEKVMPSVMLIKRYINLNGKYGVKDKANLLMEAMKRAAKLKKISDKDKYATLLDAMFKNLHNYVKNKSQKILSIQQTELNGLNGVLGCACEMNGVEDENELHCINDENTEAIQNTNTGVMNSMDFRKVQFKTLGFVGKYRTLIGDPSRGFSAMVYGKPKFGKSYFCIDFAGYLARNHGKVLYVAKEEGLDFTLQEKLNDKDVAHPNLDVTGNIPDDLTPYEFIFFDSVNKLGLSTSDLETLRNHYPNKSFIYVFQTTKEGNFRGANEFQHDVDVVIQVPEIGLAVQNGRFNQGGEMRIFEDDGFKIAA